MGTRTRYYTRRCRDRGQHPCRACSEAPRRRHALLLPPRRQPQRCPKAKATGRPPMAGDLPTGYSRHPRYQVPRWHPSRSAARRLPSLGLARLPATRCFRTGPSTALGTSSARPRRRTRRRPRSTHCGRPRLRPLPRPRPSNAAVTSTTSAGSIGTHRDRPQQTGAPRKQATRATRGTCSLKGDPGRICSLTRTDTEYAPAFDVA